MQTIERNPDIDIDFDDIPPGLQLVEGKQLQHTARAKGIPFGLATQASHNQRGWARRETAGLIIRDEHVAMLKAALAVKVALRGTPGGHK